MKYQEVGEGCTMRSVTMFGLFSKDYCDNQRRRTQHADRMIEIRNDNKIFVLKYDGKRPFEDHFTDLKRSVHSIHKIRCLVL